MDTAAIAKDYEALCKKSRDTGKPIWHKDSDGKCLNKIKVEFNKECGEFKISNLLK